MLIQLNDGTWIDPAKVLFVGVRPAMETEMGSVGPQCQVGFGGERVAVDCATLDEAAGMRDAIATAVNGAVNQAPMRAATGGFWGAGG
jgi:hypothetical protein